MTTRTALTAACIVGLGGFSVFFAPVAAPGQIFSGPAFSSIGDVRMPEETVTNMSFTVMDADGLVTNVSATVPANPGLAKISSTLNGSNVTMTIVGNFNQWGTNSVEVIATDDHGFSATNHFVLELWFNGQPPPPPLGFIPRQDVRAGDVLGPLTFSVYGGGNLPFLGTVRAVSSDQKLIPDSNILLQQAGTNLYSVTIFPVGTVSGTVNVTITAVDGVNSQSMTFNVFIDEPGNPLFSSPGPITINANQAATPYPATNGVTGLIGSIERIAVTLFDITTEISSNATVLLVGPSGTTAVLMAGAGGTNALASSTVVFEDSAANTLPQNSQMISGIYRPTVYGSIQTLPSPAPGQPYGTNLAVFKGANPNGTWQLFVSDHGSMTPGTIFGGWQLSVNVGPLLNLLTTATSYRMSWSATNVTVEQGPTVLGPWTARPDLTSPFDLPVQQGGQQFFRLKVLGP